MAGMPSGCCSSPVVADGTLLLRRLVAGRRRRQGVPDAAVRRPASRTWTRTRTARCQATRREQAFEGFFDNQDANKDGKITRDEWDTILKFMAEGKNSAFALKAGGSGDVTKSHVLWKKTRGLPYVAVGDRVPRPVRDGEGRRHRHRYDAKTGDGVYSKARRRIRQLLRLARRRERPHLLHVAERRRS